MLNRVWKHFKQRYLKHNELKNRATLKRIYHILCSAFICHCVRRETIKSYFFREIREKRTNTGETTAKWSMESVLSCEKVNNEPPTVRLTFNTIRKSFMERVYVMEYPDAQVSVVLDSDRDFV